MLRSSTRCAFAFLLLALQVFTLALSGCAPNKATVGPSLVESTDGARELRNISPATVMVKDSNGETLTGTGPTSGGYILADSDQSRWFYNGGVPVNTFVRRGVDGQVTFSMGSGKDTIIEAAELTFDPASGAMKAKGLKLSSNASEPMRAQNEAWDRLADYLKSLSSEQRQALEASLAAQVEATKVAAPVVSTALQAVLTAIKGP